MSLASGPTSGPTSAAICERRETLRFQKSPPCKFRRVESTPDPDTFEKYRDTPSVSIARCFCKSIRLLLAEVVYTPPICLTIRLPFVSRYFCRSIRVRGRWDTPNKCSAISIQRFSGDVLRISDLQQKAYDLIFFREKASRQKLTPHCLAAIFDSQLPSSKLPFKIPPKLPLPHKRGLFFFFQNCPRGEGNCAAIERQRLSRDNFCLAASRCLSRPSGKGRWRT